MDFKIRCHPLGGGDDDDGDGGGDEFFSSQDDGHCRSSRLWPSPQLLLFSRLTSKSIRVIYSETLYYSYFLQ